MSITENIAKLTATITANADVSGLKRFQAAMRQTQTMMNALAKSANELEKKLNVKLGLSNSGDKAKLDKQVRASLDRESKMEVASANAKRATFAAELAGQKLVFAQSKEAAFLTNASIKDRQQLAVLASKQQKAELDKLKVQRQAIGNEAALAQAKAKQVRIETIHAQQAQRTLNLQAQQQRTLTATQRIEQSLINARATAQRQAQAFTERQAATKVRSERTTEKHQQQQQRFQWATARQQVWEANRNKPVESSGFMGLGAGAVAVGGATAGVVAIVAAINGLGDRIGATQTRVSESQQFANILEQAAGKNPANKDFARNEFLRINAKYGTESSIDSAKAFRTFLLAEMARGKSISQATGTYEVRQQAFRGAGMTREEQSRANLQLQQLSAKTTADREDLNTFSEAAPLLVEPIRRAWAVRNKHKLDGNLEKDFRASTTKGNLKAIDFENGIKLFVKENASAIERQSNSIDANATRLGNQKFIQQQGLDQNPELIASINDRIKSEMDLNNAMLPLKATAIATDTALNKMMASFLRWTIGKEATPDSAAKKVDILSPDMPAIDVNALTGAEVPDGKPSTKDPVDTFYRWLTNAPDYSKEGPATSINVPEQNPLGIFKKLNFDKFKLPEISDEQLHPIDRSKAIAFSASDLMKNVRMPIPRFPDNVGGITNNNNNTTTNNINNTPTININVANTGATAEDIAKVSREAVYDELQKAYTTANVALVEAK